MLEVWFGVALGLLFASNAALWIKLDRCYQDLHKVIEKAGDITIDPPEMGHIKDEIVDTLQDFMESLHVPQASDHLIGGLSQIMQMWAMKKFAPVVEQIQQATGQDFD